MRDKRVIGSFLAFLSLLGSVPPVDGDPIALTLHDRDKAVPTAVAQSAQQPNEKAVVDRLFKKILDQGFLVTLTTLDELKTQAELQEPGQFLLKVEVKLKASEAVQQALEATARELGGLSLDAVLEVDYGMISWQARAFRVSTDPQILEYFQRRVASLVFVLELGLDDGGVYECSTGDAWRFPITPVRALFSYGGRSTIQGLGLSPVFNTKDYGFIAARSQPIAFIFPASIPEADFNRLTRVEGKVIERKGDESEGACMKSSKTATKGPA